MPRGIPKSKTQTPKFDELPPTVISPVSRREFEGFKEDVMGALKTLTGMLQTTGVVSQDDDNDEFAGPQTNHENSLPAQYQKIFDDIFDPRDGFTGRLQMPELDAKGNTSSGLMFTIIVPMKFSNMSDAHKVMYKQDLRSISLSADAMPSGILSWCRRVAKNIGYQKSIVSKA